MHLNVDFLFLFSVWNYVPKLFFFVLQIWGTDKYGQHCHSDSFPPSSRSHLCIMDAQLLHIVKTSIISSISED